jgi:ribosomal protein S21
MPLKATKQPRELSVELAKRFAQRLRQSGILLEARKRQFWSRPKSRNLAKRSALRRLAKRQEYLQLKSQLKK